MLSKSDLPAGGRCRGWLAGQARRDERLSATPSPRREGMRQHGTAAPHPDHQADLLPALTAALSRRTRTRTSPRAAPSAASTGQSRRLQLYKMTRAPQAPQRWTRIRPVW